MFLNVLWDDITRKRLMNTASSLTYSTLLAVVPIMAVVFGIARGFGYSIFIEQWFRSQLESQDELADTLITFVNSYLVHTQKGLFLGVGLLFMLWTVLMLISNIETAFNDVWQVKRERSIFRTFTDYLALLFLIPFVIVVSSGLSIAITALKHELHDVVVIGPMMTMSLKAAPYVLLSTAFTALYVFMPNTKVRLSSALLPGIMAGCSMQLFQVVYINSQIWISNYNAIYGSFAIIPFALLWIQTSWIICLVGAEISYCRENAEDILQWRPTEPSFNSRLAMTTRIVDMVSERFNAGLPPMTADEIKEKLGVSMRIVSALLYDLTVVNVLVEVVHDEKGDTPHYLPAESPANLTHEVLLTRLGDVGDKVAMKA